MKLEIKIPNIDKFYEECDIVEPTGRQSEWDECDKRNDKWWIGLSREEVIASKYSYKEGLDKLKQLELETPLGGSRKLYKWDSDDGDEMSLDRLYDDLPAMRKRIKNLGKGNGRFITIHASVGENAFVSYNQMLNRSYAIVQLVDYLENQGFRVCVVAYSDVADLGAYKDEHIDLLHVEVVVKQAEEPLNKSLLLTCISPWFLRVHLFKFWNAKFKTSWGYGRAVDGNYKTTDSDIYFRTGSCLEKSEADNYLKRYTSQIKEEDE